jgi:hypothetical protein
MIREPCRVVPDADKKEELILDSHCRPRKYIPGTSVMPPVN